MSLIQDLRRLRRINKQIVCAKPINKGLSNARKYRLLTLQGPLFARCEYGYQYYIRNCVLEQIKHLPFALLPTKFTFDDETRTTYSIYPFIKGKSLDSTLWEFTSQRQERLGVLLGDHIKTIHDIAIELNDYPGLNFLHVYHTTKRLLAFNPKPSSALFEINQHIERNIHLTLKRPKSLTHQDLWLSNIMLDKQDNLYLIDWENADYADPWSDLAKMTVLSPEYCGAFVRGLLYGYFQGAIPAGFWDYQRLYAAIVMLVEACRSSGFNNEVTINMSERLLKSLHTEKLGFDL